MRGVVFVGLTVVWGVVLSWVVERPFLRLRERWVPNDRKKDGRVVIEARIPVPDAVPEPVADRAQQPIPVADHRAAVAAP